MFGIMLQKFIAKWWMNLCLLLGCTLFIATAVSFPLYQNAAYDRMLRDEFRSKLEKEGVWPAMSRLVLLSKTEEKGEDIRKFEDLAEHLNENLGVTKKESIRYLLMPGKNASSTMNRSDAGRISVRLGMLSGLESHAKMLAGEMYSDTGWAEDGSIQVVVSQASLIKLKLLVGETLLVDGVKDADGNPFRFTITGVFGMENSRDYYWQVKPDNLENVLLMNPELFETLFTGDRAAKISFVCMAYALFEYEDMSADQIDEMLEKATYYSSESEYSRIISLSSYLESLNNFKDKQERSRSTLTILQIPVLIMLAAFLLMISGQMYDMERNEISVIKSRGSSRRQIFRLYFYQSVLLALLGAAFGLLLGAVFSRILGMARNFLEFDSRDSFPVTFTGNVWIYAGAAMLLVLVFLALPAIKHSKVTIVKLKQQKAMKKRSWWEKIFLDFILLGVSLYGYYTFRRDMNTMTEEIVTGQTLNPLLYISSSLFILGLGLFFLRIQPLIVQVIYLAGKRYWKPASYVSFRENVKNGRKQQFIMLFLIMTISLGMYHAIVARTIVKNATDNTEYLDNADVILKEAWEEILDEEGAPTGEYLEPDYERYLNMEGAEKITRVLHDDSVYIGTGRRRQTVTLMGIHTKEFGEITWVDKEYNGKHYYEYLNELAQNENGVLLSENFRALLGFEVGDSFYYTSSQGKGRSAKIVDFFQYWPGYEPTSTVVLEDGSVYENENYLVIANYDVLREKWGMSHYEVWIDLKDGYGSDYMYDFIQENDITLRKYVDKEADLNATLTNPLLQGTNGVLTMGFLVTLILCVVGYLIYWIMSIRSRELIFGVLRACGMHKGELFHMLMNEQIFSGLFSVAVGIGIGKLTSDMFVPMLQQAYAATDQVLPMKMVVESSDMMELYAVIAAVIVLCLLILLLLLMKLNVTKALKLGEE